MREHKHIDQLFRDSEHSPQLDLKPELWERMEKRLDHSVVSPPKPKRRYISILGVAASIALMAVIGLSLYLNADSYQVEDLIAQSQPDFSKEQITEMTKMIWQPSMITVNHP